MNRRDGEPAKLAGLVGERATTGKEAASAVEPEPAITEAAA
jgi:hypothetical protein